ncbi:potassium channel family protein [Nocardioides sp. Iso805N]|uniref:potassium channel family protein n=1 Tax=Nocardioides sp. Iso805N TaxID=1283287 RepID=UPI00038103D4|nr:potassium channel family protein [Nocardioides sp. Iso805N]
MTIRHRVRLAALLALIVLLYFVVPVDSDARGGVVLRVVAALVVFAALALLVLVQVRLSLASADRRIDGLVCAIVAVWAVFSLAFYVLQLHHPQQLDGLHTRVDALYFAASTMLTVGYGDIHATGQLARVLVLLQMAFDVVFVTTAASLLTSRLRRVASARERQQAPPRDAERRDD